MSPEQALAQRVVIDHRTDVYSLGATLYELLTLEQAFSGRDRQELLRQIAFDEPRPPRRLNRAIPGELETIVLKAMEKNPADRYGTAQELADDLERWLKDEPIRARRPTVVQRLRRWSRRHRPVVTALAAFVLTALVLVVGGSWWYQQEQAARALARSERQREMESAVTAALVQAETLLGEADKQIDFPERWQATARLALGALEKAEGLLATGEGTEELADRVRKVRRVVKAAVNESRLLVELDRIRLEQDAVGQWQVDFARAAPLYAKAFGDYGIDLAAPETAAARVRGSRRREVLLAALEDWRRSTAAAGSRWWNLIWVAAQPAPEAFRERWLRALDQEDVAALVRMADEPEIRASGVRKALLAALEDWQQRPERAEMEQLDKVLQAAEPEPNGFRVRWRAAARRWAAAARQYQDITELVKLADEPSVQRLPAAAVSNMVQDFYLEGYLPGPKRQIARAVVVLALAPATPGAPLWPQAHVALSVATLNPNAFGQKPDVLKLAERLLRAARERNPGDFWLNYKLGYVLLLQQEYRPGQPGWGNPIRTEEAIGYLRVAQAVRSDSTSTHMLLGHALRLKGDLEGACRCWLAASHFAPNDLVAHQLVARNMLAIARWDHAIVEFQEAIRLDKENPKRTYTAIPFDEAGAHHGLGTALECKGRLDDAISEYRKATRLNKDFAQAHSSLAEALSRKGQLDDAISEYREDIRIRKNYAYPHHRLAEALSRKGKVEEAIAEYREAIRCDPRENYPYFMLGLMLKGKQDWKGAIQVYQAALEVGPWPEPITGSLHRELGSTYLAMGDERSAILEYRTALPLNPLASSHETLGNLLQANNDLEGAIREYRAAVHDPKVYRGRVGDVPNCRLALGEALRDLAWRLATSPDPRSRDPRRAVELAKEGLQLSPQEGAYWWSLRGAAYASAGEWKSAIDAVQEAMKLGPGGRREFLLLSQAHERLGQTEEAKKWRTRAEEAESPRPIQRFDGHKDSVACVAFSPDGRRFLSGANGDDTVRLWDVETGKELRGFSGHMGGVQAVAFSPDGRRAFSGCSRNGIVRLWDVESGQQLHRSRAGVRDTISGVAISPDGSRALSAGYDSFVDPGRRRALRLWDLDGVKKVRGISVPGKVHAVAFSPDGRRALSSSNMVRLWDLETGKELLQFKHDGWVRGVMFTLDGRRALSASSDGTVRLWDLDSGKELRQLQLDKPSASNNWPFAVAFTPDARRVVWSRGETLCVKDLETGKEIARFSVRGERVFSGGVAISPDGRRVLWGGSDGTVRLWEVPAAAAKEKETSAPKK
jgi:tetratricopeptide (TPR) repeat protein